MKNALARFFQDLSFSFLKIIRLIILLQANLSTNLLAQSQAIKFEHITTEQGLSNNGVRSILQDSKGFMWFATADGLNKYDGYSMTIYKHDVQDSSSISSGRINPMYEDRNGTLWIPISNGGLNRLDRDTEKFTRFVHDPKNPRSLSDNRIVLIYEDSAGALWIITGSGLDRFDRNTEQFTRFVHDPENPRSLSHNSVSSIYEDRSGMLWIGTQGGGLNRFDRKTEQFTRFAHDPKNPHSLSHNFVGPIYESHYGGTAKLWIGTRDGLNCFDRNTEQFTHFGHDPKNPHSLSDSTVKSIYEDHTGTLWIITFVEFGKPSTRLNRFNRDTGQFTRFIHDPRNPHSLSNNNVTEAYEDRSGTLWIRTYHDGLNKFNREKEQFIRFVHEPSNPHSLSDNNVNSIYEDRAGALWFATANGINKFDRNQEQFIHFVHDPTNPNSLIHNAVSAIYEDHTETLWIGTLGGLSRMRRDDREQKRFTHFVCDPKNPRSLGAKWVSAIYEDHSGTLWIGTGGLNRFDREKEQFTRFVHDPGNPNSLSDNTSNVIYEDRAGALWIGTLTGRTLNRFDRDRERFTRFRTSAIFSIYEDRAGTLWVGTFSGLLKFDRQQEKFTSFKHDPRNPHGLSSNVVNAVYEDRSGTLWLATEGGLDKLVMSNVEGTDSTQAQFLHYTEKDGLPSSLIYGILEDGHGRLWLSTAKGLSRFDPSRQGGKTFRNYDATDGFQGKQFNTGAYFKNRSGEMFFGGVNGFNAFHPDSIKDNPYIPPVVITAFKRYNTDEAEGVAIAEKGISAKKAIQLSYKDNILSFEFAALSYRNTFKNQYAYKLEGFNNNWIQLGTERKITFTNLDHGKYTLRVKGSNNDGVWNEEGTSLKITITPPWWKTWWFRLAAALAVIATLAALYNYRVSKLLEIERTRLRIARDLHDDVGSSLSSIALTAELLQKESATDGLTNRQLARVHETAQKLSRNLKEIVWAIDPQRDKFDDLLLHIKETAEELLGQKGIAYTLEVPHDELPQSLKMEFRRNLFLIYKEMLHNVVKHAEATKVEIALTRTNGILQLQVADNGKGFSEEQAGNGHGMKSMQARAGELNGQLEIDSKSGRGTRVTFLVSCK